MQTLTPTNQLDATVLDLLLNRVRIEVKEHFLASPVLAGTPPQAVERTLQRLTRKRFVSESLRNVVMEKVVRKIHGFDSKVSLDDAALLIAEKSQQLRNRIAQPKRLLSCGNSINGLAGLNASNRIDPELLQAQLRLNQVFEQYVRSGHDPLRWFAIKPPHRFATQIAVARVFTTGAKTFRLVLAPVCMGRPKAGILLEYLANTGVEYEIWA